MGSGKLVLNVRNDGDSLPIAGAHVILYNHKGKPMYETHTDLNGNTDPLELEAPDKELTLDENYKLPPYSEWNVDIIREGFRTLHIKNVEIIDSQTSVLPVHLHPNLMGDTTAGDETIDITPMLPLLPEVAQQILHQEDRTRQAVPASFMPANPHAVPAHHWDDGEMDAAVETAGRVQREVFIPEFITVHLGSPNNASARNVRVPFIDYVKNVASSEIYATWPRNSLIANVHVIVTFALNRIYSEWYRSRGFQFDITNSTAFDQYYRPGAQIFQSISDVVDEYFNTYVHRQGFKNPFFTSFCSGTTATCAGLSQWGTVRLANEGRSPIEILRHYYPNDVTLTETNNIKGIASSYPGTALREGASGEAVQRIQNDLNRIRVNFPLIPQIPNPNGHFGPETTAAVRAFQRSFNLGQDGVVGPATWNEIIRVYTAVTRLAELDAEGHRYTISENPPNVILRRGSRGGDVRQLQFLLNVISQFNDSVPSVIEDANFGPQVESAVMDFQRAFGLPPDGVVGPATWNKLYATYRGIQENRPGGTAPPRPNPTPRPPTPPAPPTPPTLIPTPPFSGVLLRNGSRGEEVRLVQTYLNAIRRNVPGIPQLVVDGIFGPMTESAVRAFQRHFGLSPDGIVGPITWGELIRQFRGTNENNSMNFPAYPGVLQRQGSRGDHVRHIQRALNLVRGQVPGVPMLVVDGIFGPITHNAVVTFQRHFGLNPDGIVGPITWAQLGRSIG